MAGCRNHRHKRAEVLWGLKEEDVIGKSDFDFFPEEEALFFQKVDNKTLDEDKEVYIDEEPVSSPTIGQRIVRTWKVPLYDDGGRYILGISMDITEEKRLKKELDEEQSRNIQNSKLASLGEMASGIAHEINNPLAIISGLTEILRTNKDVENRERTFERIAHSIDRITSVTQSLLSLSEPTMLSGGGKQHSLKHFMKQIYELSRGIATKCNVEFAIEVSEESQDLTLNANQQLTEAITNIVINGIEAAEEGGENGERFTKIFVDSLGARIRIKIVDSGRGLEEKDVDDIFLPFYSTKALGKAKGLGLTVANSNIKNLGGELSLDQSGKYTCFVILLPEEELVYEHGMSREAG